jgi:hypothetical protein
MADVLDDVRDHYRATGLTERLKTALTTLGPEDQRLTPQQLAGLDQFHTLGLAATAELAKLAGIAADGGVKVTEARRHAARPPSRERRSMLRERATQPRLQSVSACRLASTCRDGRPTRNSRRW